MSEYEHAYLLELPPLSFAQVLYYEASGAWKMRLLLSLPLSYAWYQQFKRTALLRLGRTVHKNYQRYLSNYQFGQQHLVGMPEPMVAPELPSPGEVEKQLFEGTRPSFDQIMMYEVLGNELMNRSTPEQQELLSQKIESLAAPKYRHFEQLLIKGRQRYLKAMLSR